MFIYSSVMKITYGCFPLLYFSHVFVRTTKYIIYKTLYSPLLCCAHARSSQCSIYSRTQKFYYYDLKIVFISTNNTNTTPVYSCVTACTYKIWNSTSALWFLYLSMYMISLVYGKARHSRARKVKVEFHSVQNVA